MISAISALIRRYQDTLQGTAKHRMEPTAGLGNIGATRTPSCLGNASSSSRGSCIPFGVRDKVIELPSY